MDTPLSLVSPAKLNLFLHINGRRDQTQAFPGYHELQSVFQLLDRGDVMHFTLEETQDIRITPTLKDIPLKDNLIYKAAMALQYKVSQSTQHEMPNNYGIHIHIEKNLPMGGGLGGGSSNAATTLIALNHLWNTHFTIDELADLGLALGADVPVFILSKDALATGVGERLKPIELPEQHILLMFPECSVPTADVFKNDMLERSQMAVTENEAFQKDAWINACLPVVLSMYPKIKRLYEIMSTNYKVYLSGTGSTLYILFDELDLAEKAKKKALAHCKCQLI